jgi:hypothetical protein
MIPPGLIDELAPCVATVVDDVVEDLKILLVSQFAHELPDVFLRVQSVLAATGSG